MIWPSKKSFEHPHVYEVTFLRFLDIVYDYGPNIFDAAIFNAYPSILQAHKISEISNRARVALFQSALYLQSVSVVNAFLNGFAALKNNPLDRLQDRFQAYLDELHSIQRDCYPGNKIEENSNAMGATYGEAYVMCVIALWLFSRLVPNHQAVSSDEFVLSISRNIFNFNKMFVLSGKSS